MIFGACISPDFLAINNFKNILVQSSVIAPIVIGMTMVIIEGGIDLTVGSTIGLSSVICSVLMEKNINLGLIILIALVFSALVGLLNGLLVSKGKIQPFLVTLATMIIVRGLAQIIINGKFIKITNESFLAISRGSILSIPNCIIIMFVLIIIFAYVMNRTTFGKSVYAIGNSSRGSFYSGINVDEITIKLYVLSGIFAGISGILYTARLGAGEGTAGTLYEMDAIPAVIMGGTLLIGGEGKIINSFFGLLILMIIKNLLNLLNVPSTYHSIVTSAIIIIAVIGQNVAEGRRD
jgi:ribose transport system permease protein